ncbi:MAG: hypothetical protein IJK77_02235 [Lachnospiraceae bacterium]|nr:hypothetical protein [Lachnospiraceae bacterium]
MNDFSVFWLFAGPLSICLFWASAGLAVLSLRRKRHGFLLCGIILIAGTYYLVQFISYYTEPIANDPRTLEIAVSFAALPHLLHFLLLAGIGSVIGTLYRSLIRYGKNQITPMSVREAVDSLPSGICCFLTDGRILMINTAMQDLCKALGRLPLSGKEIREGLFSGMLVSGYRVTALEDTVLIAAPDGTVWSLEKRNGSIDGKAVHSVIATDVTELYQKTVLLRRREEKLSELNERLTEYNREIVSLTAEKEKLSARVRLHDEFGEDLLTIRRCLERGGSEKDREDIRRRLRRNVSFLLTGDVPAAEDEYVLLKKTAAQLGVKVTVQGSLPQAEPQKHAAATAIHECFTNTLRHAHGDELRISSEEQGDRYLICLTSNGEQPAGPIRETGGLKSLRELTEYIGGTMELSYSPVYTVTLILPKEVPNAYKCIDRG